MEASAECFHSVHLNRKCMVKEKDSKWRKEILCISSSYSWWEGSKELVRGGGGKFLPKVFASEILLDLSGKSLIFGICHSAQAVA